MMIEAGTLVRDWVDGNREGHAIEANLLIVDDVGIRKATEAQREALCEIINARGARPTIYTCNFLESELVAGVGDARLARRLLGGKYFEFRTQRWKVHREKIVF